MKTGAWCKVDLTACFKHVNSVPGDGSVLVPLQALCTQMHRAAVGSRVLTAWHVGWPFLCEQIRNPLSSSQPEDNTMSVL